jgi:hypothetical protein
MIPEWLWTFSAEDIVLPVGRYYLVKVRSFAVAKQGGNFWFNSDTGGLQIWQARVATASANYASPMVRMNAHYWTGAASATDSWSVQDLLGTGNAPASTLAFQHAGSTGSLALTLPSNAKLGIGIASPSHNLDVNGTGNFTGAVSFGAPVTFPSLQTFPAGGLSGTVAIAKGGTGATAAAGARTNLGAAASGANADITSLSKLTTPLSVAQGGTGSSAQNFVDLSSSQAIGGTKTFSNLIEGSIAGTAQNANYLGNVLASSYARLDQANSFNGAQTVAGNMAVTGNVTVTGNMTATSNVGIGTTAPQQQLHVQVPGVDSLQWAAVLQNPMNTWDANAGVGIQFKGSDYSNAAEQAKWVGIASAGDVGTTYNDNLGLAFYTHNGGGATPNEVVRIMSNGSVGIGTQTPGQLLEVAGNVKVHGVIFPDGSTQTSAGLTSGGTVSANTENPGVTVSQSGSGYGLWAASATGDAVHASGTNTGVYGESQTGVGVLGYTYGNGITSAGVKGFSNGSASGVFGQNFSSGNGVYGSSSTGIGVDGWSSGYYGVYGSSGSSVGVYGSSSNSAGVYGSSGSGNGVYGISYTGVSGAFQIANTGNSSYALWANSNGPNDVFHSDASAGGTAIVGSTTGTGSAGSFSINNNGNSTNALSVSSNGSGDVFFSYSNGGGNAILGDTDGMNNAGAFTINNTSNGSAAVYANSGGTGFGVYGEGGTWAGYFNGDVGVTGGFTNPAIRFQIDHPLDPANKYINLSAVESPDMKGIYDGVAVLDANGEAWVTLPDWFEALNRDFRYQLTCIGAPMQVYIADEIAGNRFRIAGGLPGKKVSWQVTGIRQDAWANAHRVPVEEQKQGAAQGAYLHPELYGEPKTSSVIYKEHPQLIRDAQRRTPKR